MLAENPLSILGLAYGMENHIYMHPCFYASCIGLHLLDLRGAYFALQLMHLFPGIVSFPPPMDCLEIKKKGLAGAIEKIDGVSIAVPY